MACEDNIVNHSNVPPDGIVGFDKEEEGGTCHRGRSCLRICCDVAEEFLGGMERRPAGGGKGVHISAYHFTTVGRCTFSGGGISARAS